MSEKLEQELKELVDYHLEECAKIPYNPTAFKGMITESGYFGAILRLITKHDPSAGLTTLRMNNRLDLSMEALILKNSKFHCLFNDEALKNEVLKTAKRKLKQYDYEVE